MAERGVGGIELSECAESPLKSPGGLDSPDSCDLRFWRRKKVFNVRPMEAEPVLAMLRGPKLSEEDIPSGILTSRSTFRFPTLMPSIELELNSLAPGIEKREGSDISRKEVGRTVDERFDRRGGVVEELGGEESRLSSILPRNKSIEERGLDKRQWEPVPALDGLVRELRLRTKEDEGMSSVTEDSGRLGCGIVS